MDEGQGRGTPAAHARYAYLTDSNTIAPTASGRRFAKPRQRPLSNAGESRSSLSCKGDLRLVKEERRCRSSGACQRCLRLSRDSHRALIRRISRPGIRYTLSTTRHHGSRRTASAFFLDQREDLLYSSNWSDSRQRLRADVALALRNRLPLAVGAMVFEVCQIGVLWREQPVSSALAFVMTGRTLEGRSFSSRSRNSMASTGQPRRP